MRVDNRAGPRWSEGAMHKIRVDSNGVLRCWSCGSKTLLAKASERGKRTQHLKCEECGEHQRYRQPKAGAKTLAPSAGPTPAAANKPTPVPEPSPEPSPEPVRGEIDGGTQTLTRIAWRRPGP